MTPEAARGTVPNPIQGRRPGPGLLLALASPFLRLVLAAFARRGGGPSAKEGLHVFQAYQVGDFFMALPAMRLLARHAPVTVIGRGDCLFALAGTGAAGIPFANPFFVRASASNLFATLRNALALRKRVPRGGTVLDMESDPRSAFFLRLAGFHRIVSYERAHARFFDALLPLPSGTRHQGAKNDALAEAFLRSLGLDPAAPEAAAPGDKAKASDASASLPPGTLLLSCFTRKDTKNWPYASWDKLLAFLLDQGRSLRILVPPDGDAEFQAFRTRWEGRIPFLAGDLPALDAALRASSGVIATDNFLGHMAADRGKPVLWINGSSDPELVAPRGVLTRVVQKDPMPCRPCGHRCVNPVYKQCLLELAPEAAIAAAGPWLAALRNS